MGRGRSHTTALYTRLYSCLKTQQNLNFQTHPEHIFSHLFIALQPRHEVYFRAWWNRASKERVPWYTPMWRWWTHAVLPKILFFSDISKLICRFWAVLGGFGTRFRRFGFFWYFFTYTSYTQFVYDQCITSVYLVPLVSFDTYTAKKLLFRHQLYIFCVWLMYTWSISCVCNTSGIHQTYIINV